jgi:hypothetical protein
MYPVTEFVVPWKVCIVVMVVLALLAGAQVGAKEGSKSFVTLQPKSSCMLAGWDHQNNMTQMNLNCGHEAAWTTSSEFIIWYLQHQSGGTFSCDVMKNREADNCSYKPPQ